MRFADIPGQEDVKARLRSMVDSGNIPHALLFEGPQGAGKFALARALAQYIHCEHRTPDGDSCGTCPSCRQHSSFNHIDTIYTFPVVKKGGGLSDDYIDEFRRFVTDDQFMHFENWLNLLDNINAQPQIYVEEANNLIVKLNYTTHNSKYKIVLMWLAERLREDAANKLLKLIEEPHSDTLFILTSDAPRLILPTIYSRTQRVGVKRYPDEVIASYLSNTYGIDADMAAETARLSTGNMAEAVKRLGVQKESDRYLELFMDLMRKAYTRHVRELKEWAHTLNDMGRERQMQFYDYASRMLRENFILNMHAPQLNYMNRDEMSFSAKFSPFINERNVMQLFRVFTDAKADIAANGYSRLVNFDVAIKVILLLKR